MTQAALLAYLIAFFVVGMGVSGGIILWAFGPVARKIGWAYLRKKPMLQFPRSDKQWEFVEVDKVTDKDEYVLETDEGRAKYKPDPKDVYIAGNKIPLLTGIKDVSLSISPFKAFSAEIDEVDEETGEVVEDGEGTVKWRGEDDVETPFISVNWEQVREKLKNEFDPANIGALETSAYQMNNEWEPPEKGGNALADNKWAIGGIMMVVLVVIVAFYIVSQMGII